jgi:signal transduction histidine kinase
MSNAIWAMNGKGTLSIRTRNGNEAVEVSIGDTGIGIPAENFQNIFNYLFTTKAPGEGTGQGLSIAKRLIDQNHGDIRVESKVGEGTTFFLSFPVADRDDR